jgi:HK97 family phage prohead protease
VISARPTPHESFSVPVSAAQDGATFEAWAIRYDYPVDTLPPTVIAPNAFAASLKEAGDRVLVFWSHDSSDPIGRPAKFDDTPEGLRITFRLDDAAPNGRRAAAQIKSGTLTDVSIGFDPLEVEEVAFTDKRLKLSTEGRMHLVRKMGGALGKVRLITRGALWEMSIVSHGAQRPARIVPPAADAAAKIAEVNRQNRARQLEQLAGVKEFQARYFRDAIAEAAAFQVKCCQEDLRASVVAEAERFIKRTR